MTDALFVMADDPDGPRLTEIGEDGDAVIVMNTQNPEVASRVIVEYFRKIYDPSVVDENYLDLSEATFTIGTYWWHEPPLWGETQLINASETAPPATFPGVYVQFAQSHP